MNNDERQKKVAKHSEEALENLLNLNSDQNIDVQINVDDLEFKNIDSKKNLTPPLSFLLRLIGYHLIILFHIIS